jgi:dihydroxyacetone kinase-like predicted kinase
VVVGGDGLWNVHVHVDDVGAAVEAGIEAGRPHRVRVTHFAEQVDRRTPRAVVRTGRAVVVVAAGAGLGDLFVQAGATVVPGGPGRRPSTGQVLEAIVEAGAAEVIVLPNDRDSIAAAEAAARTAREESDLRVAVIRTHAQVQGLAALAVHEPGRPFEQDILEMTAAARHARSGAVTVAARQAMTTAGPCEPGDVLGAIEGDFVLVGDDLFAVATEVLERLLGGGGELVTVVAGADAGDLAERCAAHLGATHPTVDVVVYAGGQQRYPLLVGVE